jgi:hypothetical protein
MAPRWAEHARPLVLVLLAIDLVVTLVFKADVDAQGGAYATGVLALMLSAAVAVALSLGREAKGKQQPGLVARTGLRARLGSLYFWGVAGVFAFTFVDNVLVRPDGLIISLLFIAAIIVLSAVSRVMRAAELRVETLIFEDPESERLWAGMKGKKVALAPLRADTPDRRKSKLRALRKQRFGADVKVAFIHVTPSDDRSNFGQALRLRVEQIPEGYFIHARNANAIPNAIAYLSEQLDPVALYFDLSLENPMNQTLNFLLFGEGEVGVMVYQILVRYWHSTDDEDVRPDIYLVSR